ncbi:MAG: hypothetical protein FJ104_16385 [Deltaproteobacteria bacterium]|nr:hypothetical protein [Deltaproteobacteria bacterium]
MNRVYSLIALTALGLAVACEQPAPPAPSAAAPSAPPPAPLPAPKVAPDVPTAEDFEQEAAEQIDGTNAEKELEVLEREVGAAG